jgi:NADPH2:quinone reductase
MMDAIFTDPGTQTGFTFRKTAIPVAGPRQALIRVKAFSLNQGETRTALAATSSYIPGWDFAGEVVKAAADGSTPKEGSRVFGYVAQGAWAGYVVAPGGLMAEIPEGVTYTQAACLPIAGVTALGCLDASGIVQNRRILITGASGGVGRFACQLAAMAGATIFAVSRRSGLVRQFEEEGTKVAGVYSSVEEARAAGEYDVIWDSIGGDALATAVTALARNGICVNFGNSARQPTTLNVRAAGWPFHGVRCVWLGREPVHNSTPMLDRLARMVDEKQLRTPIDCELSWTGIADAAERLVQQRVNGKIVLRVED